MTSSNPKIITLEEGWNEEIKKKVSFAVSAGTFFDQQGMGAGMHFGPARWAGMYGDRLDDPALLAPAVFALPVGWYALVALCGGWCRPGRRCV